jgi:hypothetical protein
MDDLRRGMMTGRLLATPWRRLAGTTSLVALLGVLMVVGARAESPSAAPTTDALAASLLTADDLPGYLSSGILTETDLDIDRPAFDEAGGTGFLMQVWVSQDEGVVFDDRMLFPTPEAALAYLEAAEPTLSEAADAGLALVRDDPPLTAATRHWAGDTTIGDQQVAMDVWLVPVGPVAAKVAVTVFGPGLDRRRAIAEEALARLETQYGPATAEWPEPAPGASPSPGASSSPGVSPSPGASPSPDGSLSGPRLP